MSLILSMREAIRETFKVSKDASFAEQNGFGSSTTLWWSAGCTNQVKGFSKLREEEASLLPPAIVILERDALPFGHIRLNQLNSIHCKHSIVLVLVSYQTILTDSIYTSKTANQTI